MERIVVNLGDALQPRSKIVFKMEAVEPYDVSVEDGLQSTVDSIEDDSVAGIEDGSEEESLLSIVAVDDVEADVNGQEKNEL
jgi:hypothetical protein